MTKVEGFFSETEMDDIFVGGQKSEPDCLKCGLYKDAKSPKMKYTGHGKLKCLIVGEGPGGDEDENWKSLGYSKPTQFIGKAGQFKQDKLKEHGLDLNRDFWKMNAINCRAFKVVDGKKVNKDPTSHEIECCRPMINNAIEELKPRFIWLLGTKAIESFYQGHFKNHTMARWRGLCIPDRKTNAYIIPIYHPSHPMRDPKNDNLQAQYDRDIKFAIDCFKKKPFTFEDEREKVKCLYTYDGVLDLLDFTIEKPPDLLYIDYETTGIKPFRPGHKIISISLCRNENQSLAFPYDYKNHFTPLQKRQIKKKMRQILTYHKIGKLAHNIQFEHLWGRKILGIETTPWHWDTMIGARVLDNRRKYTGLKFQVYINFGVLPYDKSISKYIKGDPFNKMEEARLNDLLPYGGLDSLYGMMLYNKHHDEYQKGNFQNAYELFHEGSLELAEMEYNGIYTDEEYCYEESKRIEEKQIELIKELLTSKEAKRFKKETGRDLSLTSTKDLGELFYEVLKLEAQKTAKGNYSVDEESLKKIDLPFVDKLLRTRKLEKIKGTYLAGFAKSIFVDRMHPSTNLIVPVSYRSSMSNPNVQNIPKRNKEAQKACRQAIKPTPGNKLLDWDYSNVEVCIAACVSKDKSLIKYVKDPSTDMHRDSATDIWILPKKEITEDIRFYAKNDWTFAEFYGDWYKAIAPNLREDCFNLKTVSGIRLKDHLKSVGIRTFNEFIEHLKEVERIFWEERFPDYKDWKNKINHDYRKKGYIETDMGFRYSGYMTYNQASNYPIQGPAFHCLLWTLKEIGKIARKEKWRTKSIIEIHDAGVNDLVPFEQDHVISTINEVGTKKIREVHDWITVPLKIDFEISEIDGNWYDMKEVKWD